LGPTTQRCPPTAALGGVRLARRATLSSSEELWGSGRWGCSLRKPRLMTTTIDAIRTVSVITTGDGEVHHEHVYGTRKPELWWIFFGRRWVRLPINVYVIDHRDGLVLFDTGQDRAVVTDPDYYPDRITAFFYRHIFRNIRIGPEDTLPAQLDGAGHSATQVIKGGRLAPALRPCWRYRRHPAGGLVRRRGGIRLHAWARPSRAGHGLSRPHRDPWREVAHDPLRADRRGRARAVHRGVRLMGDGSMIVLRTPGHLEGSVSMLVRRRAAPPLLLVGDLTYDEQLLDRDQVGAVGDPVQLCDTYAKVRSLKEHTPDLVILPAHDPHAAEKLLPGVAAARRAE
jgi:N-acyl homoserine lactone hydrolase